ncbi:MAG: OprO/OprP family phosphate-selective porin [Prevotellaceae bacterium]|nr:OprO/OprP family phosphate-selective porin [Prevotellaceae bacterium]
MKHLLFTLFILSPLLALAESRDDDCLPGGFVTSMLNDALERAVAKADTAQAEDKPEYGRNVGKYASAPVFGGYIVGSYKYSSEQGAHNGAGFGIRNLRVYVNGTVLRDFYYRVQAELSGSPHLKDAYLEWRRLTELRVKLGQYKRPFTFENPLNPWDVGAGDYSQLAKKLAGYSDYSYSEASGNNGGRDLGLQLSGDLIKLKGGRYRLLHYEAGVFNGQGINTTDANGKKDWMGNIQLQPVEGLYLGVFGWKGSLTEDGVTVSRDRWAVGAQYERKDWTARAEYAHHVGHKISDYVPATDLEPAHWQGNARADAWYVTVGVPCTPWLKLYAKYDAYRSDKTNATLCSMYTICPNFQLHKNLMLQVQYNYVCDKTAASHSHHELWAETYIRF